MWKQSNSGRVNSAASVAGACDTCSPAAGVQPFRPYGNVQHWSLLTYRIAAAKSWAEFVGRGDHGQLQMNYNHQVVPVP